MPGGGQQTVADAMSGAQPTLASQMLDPNSAASRSVYQAAGTPGTPAPGGFDPLSEARQRVPALASMDDAQLYRNLSEPANFRIAFPEYAGLDDKTIQGNMAQHDPEAPLKALEAQGVRPVESLDPATLARERAAQPRESFVHQAWRTANTPLVDLANEHLASQGDPLAIAMEREGGPSAELQHETVDELAHEPSWLRPVTALATAVPNAAARLGTPLGVATLGAGPAVEGAEAIPELATAMKLAGGGADVAFGSQGVEQAVTPRQPGESLADYMERVGTGAGQAILPMAHLGPTAGDALGPTVSDAMDRMSSMRPKETLARAMRTPEGDLRPVPHAMAGGAGGAAGYALGGPYGAAAGAALGYGLLDKLIPDRPFEVTPAVYDEARNEMFNEKGDALMQRGRQQAQLDQAHADELAATEKERLRELADWERFREQDAQAIVRRGSAQDALDRQKPPGPSLADAYEDYAQALMRRGRVQDGIDTARQAADARLAAGRESGYGVAPDEVLLAPEPGEIGDSRWMASIPRDQLLNLAMEGRPGAAEQLHNLGRPVLYIPREALSANPDLGQAPVPLPPRTQPTLREAMAARTAPAALAPAPRTLRAAMEFPERAPIGPQSSGLDGSTTQLNTAAGKMPATYRVVEASSLTPSHDAMTFAQNPKYPEGVQERAYHSSKEAQGRVIEQAQRYDPSYTINTNPDAVNGPPIVRPDGVVLGGNSRTMSTQRLYGAGQGDVYRNALMKQAGSFGLDPEAIAGMKQPVLVREVQGDLGQEGERRLASDLNRSMTGALGTSEKAVSVGKSITPDTFDEVARMRDDLGEDATLRDVMRAHGGELVRMLERDGAITGRERPALVDPASGGLSEEGKTFLEHAMLGKVVGDPDVMQRTPRSVLAKLEGSLGDLARIGGRQDEFNILPTVRDALDAYGEMARTGLSVDDYLNQGRMFGQGIDPRTAAMVRTLAKPMRDVRAAFRQFGADAQANVPGQGLLQGMEAPSAQVAYEDAFAVPRKQGSLRDEMDRRK